MGEDLVNVSPSTILYGKLLFAQSNSCPINGLSANIGGGTQVFTEKLCLLKVGFFLEVRSTESNSLETEIHAICLSNNKVQLMTHSLYGFTICIEKNPTMYIFLASKDLICFTGEIRIEGFSRLCGPSQTSIIPWYIVLKGCLSQKNNCVLNVVPSSQSQTGNQAFCTLLTYSEAESLCLTLPTFDDLDGSFSTKAKTSFITKLDAVLEGDQKVYFTPIFTQTYPLVHVYRQPHKQPVLFELPVSRDEKYENTVLQVADLMTDFHYLSLGSTCDENIKNSHFLIEEQIFSSPLTHYIPIKLITAFIHSFSFSSQLLNEICNEKNALGLESTSKKSEVTNVVNVLKRTVEYLRDVCALMYQGLDETSFLKKSDALDEKWSYAIPVNLQTYRTGLSQVDVSGFESLSKTSKPFNAAQDVPRKLLKSWEITTVGCPSAHAMEVGGSYNGNSYNRFEDYAKLKFHLIFDFINQFSSLHSSLRMNGSAAAAVGGGGGGDDSIDGSVNSRMKGNKIYSQLNIVYAENNIRRDLMILSLIITPLCTALVRNIENRSDDLLFWKIMAATKKVHFSWASFINDNGKEYEMLKDFVAAVNYVNNYVKFIFYESKQDCVSFPEIEVHFTGDIYIRIGFPASNKEAFQDERSVFVSTFLKEGHEMRLDCAVYFLNQRVIPAPAGADAGSASNAFGGKVTALQDGIFRSLDESFVKGFLKTIAEKFDTTNGRQYALGQIEESRQSLSLLLNAAVSLSRSAKFPASIEHIHEFIHASHLTRCIRLTSCKSAKDRTSMSSTYEMSQLIVGFLKEHEKEATWHNTKEQVRSVLVDSLRRGVRLKNCMMNSGQPRYKFKTVNYRYLPSEFKPPEGTYTSSAAVST